MIELLRNAAHDRGATVLVVAHDARIIPYADRVFYMEDGCLRETEDEAHGASWCCDTTPRCRRTTTSPACTNNRPVGLRFVSKPPVRGDLPMSPSPTRPSSPRLRTSWWVLLGVALLAVSVLGAGKGLQSSGDSTTADAPKTSDLNAGGFGYVDVDGGVTNIYTSQPGDVVAVLVQEGEDVAKDAPLFKVDDRLAQMDLDRANLALKDAELLIEAARNKVKAHHAGLTAKDEEIAGKQAKVDAAQFQVNEADAPLQGGPDRQGKG